MSISVVSFDTARFRFVVYADSETLGRALLREAWANHCQRTGADPAYLDEFYEDVTVVEITVPSVTRDGEVISTGDPGCDNQPSLDRVVDFALDERIGFDVGPDHPEFSMDEVCALLHYHLGIQAYVEYTGGGCATIFAGTQSEDGYWSAAAGAGSFERGIADGLGKATGSWHDFAIGPDSDDHPQFADQLVNPEQYGITSTRQIAALIALYVIDAASFDNVTAIALDGTHRGDAPQNGA